MQTGSYNNGERCGIWKRYHADGWLFDRGEYSGERKIGSGEPGIKPVN